VAYGVDETLNPDGLVKPVRSDYAGQPKITDKDAVDLLTEIRDLLEHIAEMVSAVAN